MFLVVVFVEFQLDPLLQLSVVDFRAFETIQRLFQTVLLALLVGLVQEGVLVSVALTI